MASPDCYVAKKFCFISRICQRLAKFFTNSVGASKLLRTAGLDKTIFILSGIVERCFFLSMSLNCIHINSSLLGQNAFSVWVRFWFNCMNLNIFLLTIAFIFFLNWAGSMSVEVVRVCILVYFFSNVSWFFSSHC